jgi:hypothetical protein
MSRFAGRTVDYLYFSFLVVRSMHAMMLICISGVQQKLACFLVSSS